MKENEVNNADEETLKSRDLAQIRDFIARSFTVDERPANS
jgi:hypothetical protein